MRRALLILLLAATLAPAQDEPKVWVHAPAEDLLGLFPEKGAGFLISIEEYRKLLGLARTHRDAQRERPPLAARLVRAVARGRLDGDVLRIETTYGVVVQGDEPVDVPFPVHNAAIESIEVEGGEFSGSSLRFEKAGTYTVRAVISSRLRKSGEIRRVAFRLPPAAGHTLTLELPAGVEGEVGPIVRAFNTKDAASTVIGFPDHTGLFRLWVRPRAEARKLDPILSASFDTIATLAEARTITSTSLALEVLRAPIDGVAIRIGAGQNIRALSGKRIKSWRVDGDTLRVRFVEPVQGIVTLRLEAELPRGDGDQVEIPFPRVERAVRYRGTVGLRALPEVRVTSIVATGARRIDRLPKGILSVHEIWSQTAKVTATVERVASKTRAFGRVLLAFREGGKSLRVLWSYNVAGKPLFHLEPQLPAGWILRHIKLDGRVPPHRFVDGRLSLVFPQGLKPGAHVLDVGLDTDEVDWVPNEGVASVALSGLRSGLDEESGYLVVASDPAFRVGAKATTGLLPVGMPQIAAAGFQTSDRVLYAWRFDAPAYAAGFTLERHKPQVTAIVVNRAYPSERLLKTHATVRLSIERTGVRELKVALPRGTGKLVDFQGAWIKEKRAPEADADPEVWTLVFQRRIRGKYRFDLSFDRKFDEDAWSTALPAVAVLDAQERGFVVVHTSATTALTVERDGMREADVGELPEPPKQPPLEVLAYAKHPYTVMLGSRRHDPHEVLQAIALSAHIYGVLSHDGHLRCRAEYRVRNNDQPFLGFALPANSRLIGVLVDGEPAKPLREKGALKVPLARSRNRTAPFVVALVYETEVEALETKGNVTIERPTLDIDVLKTRYTVHMPGGYELTGHDGDMVPLGIAERRTVLGDLLGAVWIFPGASMMREDAEVQSEARKAVNATPMAPASEAVPPPPPAPSSKPSKKVRRSLEARKKSKEKTRDELRSSIEDKDGDGTYDDAEVEMEEEVLDEPAAEERDGRRFARGGRPTPKPARRPAPARRRKQPERALLSLDVQFLRTDNVHRLDSLAPTGGVTLRYARTEVFDRHHYVGMVLGAALAVAAFAVRRFSLLRLAPAALLVILALHFGGASFLAGDFARGAATSIVSVFLLALLVKLVRKARHIRLPRRKTIVPLLLLAATAAQAQSEDEILVPYSGDNIDTVERVFLRAKEYHRLRRLAFPDAAERATVFRAAEYKATLSGEELTVTARYDIWKETETAERIPLMLTGIAVSEARLDGEPANLHVEKQGYVLVLTGKGRRVLELTLRPRLQASGESRSFSVPIRPVAGARLLIEHDRSGHEVEVIGLGASARGLHHIGPVAVLAAAWSPKTEGFIAPEAELRAHTEAVASVRDGYTSVAARIRYGISGGTAQRFRVRVGKDLIVRRVIAKNLAGWEQDKDGVLRIALTKPAKKSHLVEIHAERPAAREREEAFPQIVPLDVLRDAGVLALDSQPDLKLELIETKGLLRGRADQAPKKLGAAHAGGALHSVHRFAVRPFTLRWRVFLEATRLRATTDIAVAVGPKNTDVLAIVRLTVERGPGPFEVRVRLPKDYEVMAAHGTLRDWWVQDGVLHMARPMRQKHTESYQIHLRRRGATDAPFDAPALSVVGAARESGLLRVAVKDGLELDATGPGNLLPEDIARVAQVPGAHLRRAYRFVSVPWRLSLATRTEQREMEALVVSRVVPMQDRIRVEALVNFYVRRGLVDELSFVVPAKDALVSAPDLREETSEEVDGGTLYTLKLRTPTRGSASAAVTYYVPYDEPLRGVEPRGTSRVQRYVGVEKVPDGEVRVLESHNLETGGFDDLPLTPPEMTAQTVARVFVGSGGPFRLDVKVQRHAFEEVAKAVIYRAAAQAVVDRTGWTRVLMIYRVYNRSEQFLKLRLPGGARLYSVLVAGEGVRPLMDGADVLVPLRKLALGAPSFDVDVVYQYTGPAVDDARFDVQLPEVRHLEVRRTTLSVYVPKGYEYTFDDRMETVDEADIAAGEAADVYEEIKEAYAVAERGNELQRKRAFSNVVQLETQALALADKVQSLGRNFRARQQVKSQQAALGELRRNYETSIQTFTYETETSPDAQKRDEVRRWDVNRGYLNKRQQDDNLALKDFKAKQERAKAPADMPTLGATPQAGRLFKGQIGIGGGAGGGGAGKHGVLTIDGVLNGAGPQRGFAGGETGVADKFNRRAEDWAASAGLADSRARLEALTRQMRMAKGRLSIRIDLPLEGDVYHFARLGADGGVSFEAGREKSDVLEGFLALLCAAGAAFVLRYRLT